MESEGVVILRQMVHELNITMDTVQTYLQKKGTMQKVAESGKIDPTDAEQEFYIRNFTVLGEMLTRLKLVMDYMEKPVKSEGTVKRTASGNLMLNDVVLKAGSMLEFQCNGKWDIGTLQGDPSKGYLLFNPKMEGIHIEFDELPAKIR